MWTKSWVLAAGWMDKDECSYTAATKDWHR